MGRAEVGSTKWVSNQQKSKGLGRLRWYCQVCERQMRDENGFKMHVQSESHVRQILIVGEDPKKAINEFSTQFNREFLQQLRTSHGTKAVHINHFYQEYIANKEHVHMNATRWPSLTEYAKYLGREGLCRVEETDKGLHIAWIDNSPEALKRAEAIRKKEMLDKGDEERELRMIREQQKRAERAAEERKKARGEDEQKGDGNGDEEEQQGLRLPEGEKITLSFGTKPKDMNAEAVKKDATTESEADTPASKKTSVDEVAPEPAKATETPKPTGFSFGAKPQAKNVFAQAKKNALSGGGKKAFKIEQPKKISEAERIMREEMERKRSRESSGGKFNKRPRLG
ncbi:domain of Kin17 curved DNA-binding protein-domain-containing protein [Coniella lustricola]|uniref:Domain of Kin17 curved DNA-binding protein-domain-containing protein n=1 Tax=Coniella lustricola TaxID=2025994 RepID=A0A2T3AL83_9PEZI|nr:domain of Kin17 curved DNA-binding protein-domain-containing protein [Coniella lustricola]